MKNINFLILFVVLLNPIFGQQYDTDFIVQKADSILKITVGDSIHRYFKYDTDSYYEYINRFGKTKWETLDKKIKTKGDFVEVNVRFYLDYPPVDEVGGTTHIHFDKNLIHQDTIYLDFIPDFLKENRDCDFISSSHALGLARDSLSSKGLYDLSTDLDYDVFIKKYVYKIYNYLSENLDFAGNKQGNVEIMIIDAMTGEIIDHYTSWYGPVY